MIYLLQTIYHSQIWKKIASPIRAQFKEEMDKLDSGPEQQKKRGKNHCLKISKVIN